MNGTAMSVIWDPYVITNGFYLEAKISIFSYRPNKIVTCPPKNIYVICIYTHIFYIWESLKNRNLSWSENLPAIKKIFFMLKLFPRDRNQFKT